MIFQQGCKLGLKGIFSKRLSAPYRSGPRRSPEGH
jgi:ATP-dependent DNA ligase